MSKTIEEIPAPKPEARPRLYAYSIDDKAHKGAPIEATTGGVSSQPRRGGIFVETPHTNTKLRRSDIDLLMPPLRGFGEHARLFYKDGTPTEFTKEHPTGLRR